MVGGGGLYTDMLRDVGADGEENTLWIVDSSGRYLQATLYSEGFWDIGARALQMGLWGVCKKINCQIRI